MQSHIVHQPSRRGPSDVSQAPEPSSPFALRSFQGNMCAGILPQLRQGLARSAVGTERVWETEGLSLSPSLTDTQPHSHSLSSTKLPPSLVFLTRTVNLPPPLSHPIFCLSSTFSLQNFQFVSLQLTLIKPHFHKFIFHCFPSHLFNRCTLTPFNFLLFILFSPLSQPPRISTAFSPNSSRFSEVHGSSVLPSPAPSLLPLNASPAFILKACLEESWRLLHE